jgi:hypothetical protein
MTMIGNYAAHLKCHKRPQHHALQTQRLAYHLVDGIYSRTER